jgi:septal ring factor EnvC (AmiA/AmiB activator)
MAENENAPATKKDVAAVKEDVAAVKEDVAAVKEDVAAVKEDVAAVKEDVAAVKEDVAAVKEAVAAVKKDLAAVETRLDVRMDSLSEQMRDMQTELLKAFLPWQQDVKIQFRELEINTGNSVQAIKERMDVLQHRLQEIEKRLLMNPPAA